MLKFEIRETILCNILEKMAFRHTQPCFMILKKRISSHWTGKVGDLASLAQLMMH